MIPTENKKEFNENLKKKSAAIAMDFKTNRDVLLLAFGGFAGQLGMPMYEFHNITAKIKSINKIYLRDIEKIWYHTGLPGAGKNIDNLASFLREYTNHSSTKKVVVVGSSGGGYAALLFGHLLNADEVHAFSPKTFLNPIRRLIHNDPPRGGSIMDMVKLLTFGQYKYFNIERLFSKAGNTKTEFHIYFPDNQIDKLHAENVARHHFAHLHPYNHFSHNLVKHLKETGELDEILTHAFNIKGRR